MVIDNRKRIMDDLIERVKDLSIPDDASAFFKFFPFLSDEQKEIMKKLFTDTYDKAGNLMLLRAFNDGSVTEAEYKQWEEWGMSPKDLVPILQAHFCRSDGSIEQDDEVYLVTLKECPMFRNKDFFEKKFNVTIVDVEKVNEIMD